MRLKAGNGHQIGAITIRNELGEANGVEDYADGVLGVGGMPNSDWTWYVNIRYNYSMSRVVSQAIVMLANQYLYVGSWLLD